ncbi:phospholysine phosphohistidine inorganic pyrophosphate phosphatase-like [Motacilla alba alba]|uniref:phospholysine phosphohistidine inorganic pyrophosphate phosphatase-like n=1 Tax=Motacilla alba alba TaxID=1094192 RepID=UPI0018D55310|nr:phospholysine phosphohistidine inorganic pyrophosphate phosphatase-like [Motacilla alba alba]XP_037982581.1 phospholysine phosphohistidine inorganic pyrophosphate phosphatase-like [Motacilla alba alba]
MAERGRGWARAVRGLLLDVSGVLYDSGAGGGVPIAGSAEAVRRMQRRCYQMDQSSQCCQRAIFEPTVQSDGAETWPEKLMDTGTP